MENETLHCREDVMQISQQSLNGFHLTSATTSIIVNIIYIYEVKMNEHTFNSGCHYFIRFNHTFYTCSYLQTELPGGPEFQKPSLWMQIVQKIWTDAFNPVRRESERICESLQISAFQCYIWLNWVWWNFQLPTFEKGCVVKMLQC